MEDDTELLRPIDFGSLEDNDEYGIPEGDHMTLDEFVTSVDCGVFNDYDGHGVFASKTHKSERRVHPSDVPPPHAEARKQAGWYPAWATHVLWYNK